MPFSKIILFFFLFFSAAPAYAQSYISSSIQKEGDNPVPPTLIPIAENLDAGFTEGTESLEIPMIIRPPAPKKISETMLSFLHEKLIPRESLYFSSSFGFDPKTGMPYDHVRIRAKKEIFGEIGNYTAASKLSLSIPFLLGVASGKTAFKKIEMKSPEALELLEKTLQTLLTYNRQYPSFGGFLPWVDIQPNGKIAPASNKIPSLDNGQLTWALVSVVSSWENSSDPSRKKIAELAAEILAGQNYIKFYDPQKKMLFGTIQKVISTERWQGDQTYYLNDMFEGTLAVLWAVLNRQIPEEAWYSLEIPTVDYRTSTGETITTFRGFRASFHEHWALAFLPLMESPLDFLYRNYLHVQADFARRRGLPGFLSTAYDPRGSYRQMGIPDIAANPVDRDDVAVVFATAMALFIDPAAGSKWLKNLYDFGSVTVKFGAVESVGEDGYADIFTADAKGMTILAASGGVSEEIKTYLMTHNVPGTQTSLYAKWLELIYAKYLQMIMARSGKEIQMPSLPCPLPPPLSQTIQVKEVPLFDPGKKFDVSAHFQKGHLHGKNVWSVGLQTLEDDSGPKKNFEFEFGIDPAVPYFDQWAFRGTYIDKAAKISDMNYLRITIPAFWDPMLYEITLKSDDITLASARVDTSAEGELSRTAEWKTITYKIYPIPEAEEKPFNYFAVAIHDPRYLNPEFAPYGRRGMVNIKDIELLKTLPTGETEVEENTRPILPDSSEIIQYWRPSHGDMPFKRSFRENAYQFPSGPGWRGGYLPYIGVSEMRYFRIKIRNLENRCNCLNLEIKHEDTLLMGYKIPVMLPESQDWQTLEIEIPENMKTSINYFALSDSFGNFEISSISFSQERLPEDGNLIRIPAELKNKPLRCAYRCSAA